MHLFFTIFAILFLIKFFGWGLENASWEKIFVFLWIDLFLWAVGGVITVIIVIRFAMI